MANLSIYLDTYHDSIVRNCIDDGNVSGFIQACIDEWFRENWSKIPNAKWNNLVIELEMKSLTGDFDYIPLSQLRESVAKWHLARQHLPN